MSNIFRVAFCTLILFFSLSAHAARPFQYDCGRLHLNKGFDVVFRITNVQHQERVIMTGENGNKKILWSNVPGDDAVINDSDPGYKWTVKGQDYDIWLHYTPGQGNRPGKLGYYFYRWDFNPPRWGLAMENRNVNISKLSQNIYLSGENTEIMDCSGNTEPERSPTPEPDYCELFPGSVQTWQGNKNNLITMQAQSVIKNTIEHRVGFSNQIVNPPNYPAAYTPLGQLHGAKCDGEVCQLNGKMAPNDKLIWYRTSKPESAIVTGQFEGNIEPGTYYQSLTVNSGSNFKIPAGSYWFDKINIQGVLKIEGEVILHVKESFEIDGKVNTSSPRGNLTVLAYYNGKSCPNTLFMPSGPPQVNPDFAVKLNRGARVNGRIYSRGPVALSNDTTLKGAVTACQLEISNTTKIIGDNSDCVNPQPKNRLQITPKRAYGLTCERMPVLFSVVPKNNSTNKPDDTYSGTLVASVTSASPEKSCWALTPNDRECTPGNITVSLSGGQRQLWLQSRTVGDIKVEGRIGDLKDKAGPYRFAPFGFRVNGGNPAQIVAGKSQSLLIEAVADTGAKCEVIEDYGKPEGEPKNLDLQSLGYVRPSTANVGIELGGSTLSSGQVLKNKTLTFVNGKARLPVTYNDAGEIAFELVDKKWQSKGCTASSTECADHEKNWKGLKGKAVIYSRPYTFALCNIQSARGKTVFAGTSRRGDGFATAGEKFRVSFKPVIWQPGLANTGGMTTTGSSWCQVPTTPNYYSVDKLISAPLKLSHRLDTPSGGESGELHGGGTYSFKTRQEASQGLLLDNLSWSEVGSLQLQADATYLGMDVDQGSGVLGRFYPHHFALKSSELVDAVANKFTYMDQAFSASFEVEAQNKAGVATLNYGDFAADYQDKLALVAADGGVVGTGKNELTPRLDKGGLPSEWAKKWIKARLQVNNALVGFKREVTKSLPKTTTPDGPYDVRVGLVVDKSTDKNNLIDCNERGCTDFANQDLDIREENGVTPVKAKALAGNITARYGRLKLDDVNSQFDKSVNIPLQAQYWDSSVNAFIPNIDDSLSEFDGSNYCKQVIWPTEPKEAEKSRSIMQGSGTVSRGESYLLEATPDRSDYFREQVRFWLRLAKSPQSNESSILNCKAVDAPIGGAYYRPWLQYNWRDKGDEDPSAIVTFGVYRGNDRIIYRGEKGMNHLLN